jgi:hypothetical protein
MSTKRPPSKRRSKGPAKASPAKGSRDDFLQSVIRKLRERVGFRCSKPDCRVPTSGPGDDPDESAHFGQAAHIAAAAPGGPRYDSEMTSEQRRSFANGIWLCCNHATEIDANRAAFSPELLRTWKSLAEQRARDERGKRQPEAADARAAVLAALTGTASKATLSAITNTHAAVQQLLHELDPRLRVDTTHANGVTNYFINPLQDISFQMMVPANHAVEWNAGLKDVFDHGREVRLPADGLCVTGSPVFERLMDPRGLSEATITISTLGKPAVQKLRLIGPTSQAIEQFDDIQGNIVFGRRSITVDGKACGGLVATSLRVEAITTERTLKSTFDFTVHFDSWDRVDVRHLPYFEKLHSVLKRMRQGWQMDLDVETEGRSMGGGRATLVDREAIGHVAGLLAYISALRTIAASLDVSICFVCEASVSRRAFDEAQAAAHRIEGRVLGQNDHVKLTMTVPARGRNIQELLSMNWNEQVLQYVGDSRSIEAFGQTLQLPPCRVEASHFQLRLLGHADVASIREGDDVPIELVPSQGFRLVERFLRPSEPDVPAEASQAR